MTTTDQPHKPETLLCEATKWSYHDSMQVTIRGTVVRPGAATWPRHELWDLYPAPDTVDQRFRKIDAQLHATGYRRVGKFAVNDTGSGHEQWSHVCEVERIEHGTPTCPCWDTNGCQTPFECSVTAADYETEETTSNTDTSTEGDTAATGGDDEDVVIPTLYAHLDATQKSLERAERRAEQLRRDRLTLAKALTEEGEAIATVAARMGVSKQYLHKQLTAAKAAQPEQTSPMF
jgi:hypothetical protein